MYLNIKKLIDIGSNFIKTWGSIYPAFKFKANTAYGEREWKSNPIWYSSAVTNFGIKMMGNIPIRKFCGADRVRSDTDLGPDTGNTGACPSGKTGNTYWSGTNTPYMIGMDFEKNPMKDNKEYGETKDPYGVRNVQIGPMTLSWARSHDITVQMFADYDFTDYMGEFKVRIPTGKTSKEDDYYYFKKNGAPVYCTNSEWCAGGCGPLDTRDDCACKLDNYYNGCKPKVHMGMKWERPSQPDTGEPKSDTLDAVKKVRPRALLPPPPHDLPPLL